MEPTKTHASTCGFKVRTPRSLTLIRVEFVVETVVPVQMADLKVDPINNEWLFSKCTALFVIQRFGLKGFDIT